MATDAFIKLHEGATVVRVNTHRILTYKSRQHGNGSLVQLNVGGVSLQVDEQPEEIDAMVTMAVSSEKKAKHDHDK